MADKKQEAFFNFRLSNRSTIRQPPNVVTWIAVLLNLKAYGMTDPAALVKEHNDTVAAGGALVGSKALMGDHFIDLFPGPDL